MAIGWHPYPMVRLLLPLSAGLWCGSHTLHRPPFLLLVALLLVLSATGVKRLKPRTTSVLNGGWWLWLFLLGWVMQAWTDPLRDPANWSGWPGIKGSVIGFQGELLDVASSGDKWRMTVRVDSLAPVQEGAFFPVKGKVLLYAGKQEPGEKPLPGLRMSFTGKAAQIRPAMDPKGFDWQWYQRVRGVSHQVYTDSTDWKSSTVGATWRYPVARLRAHWETVFDRYLEDPLSAQVAKALVLGSRSDLDDALNEAYQASGSVHVLAVSGLHVGLVAAILMGVLGLFFRHRKLMPLKALFAVPLVWGYVFLTGAADSALRAGVLFSVILLGKVLSRQAESLNLLATAVTVLLIFDPWLIHHAGFLLSVFAVAGILFFHPLLYRAWFPGKGIPNFFWNLACVTVAAQAATVMLSLFFFHRFPVYFLISGLFVVPVSSVLLTSGLSLVLVDSCFPILSFLPATILQWSCSIMNGLVLWISGLPVATINDLWPMAFWAVLFPIVLAWGLHAWIKREKLSFVRAALLLSLGLAVQAGFILEKRSRDEWFVLRRTGEGTRLLISQGDDLLAWDPLSSEVEVGKRIWEGWGQVWELPAKADFRYGLAQKKGEVLRLGKDSLSWGSGVKGNFHLGLPGVPPSQTEVVSSMVLLLPELGWRERRHWEEWAKDKGLSVLDLRESGYLLRPLN